ncbi:MAG: T9SS type A sorting domain-containing protein [Bacteroidota bacterium]
MKSSLITISVACLITLNPITQMISSCAGQDFQETIGGTSDDHGRSIQQTADGGYIFTGYTNSFGAGGNDVFLIKTDANGDTVWTKAYGGSGDDFGKSVGLTSDNGFIVSGYTNSFGAGNYDIYLIKTDSIGDTLWTKTCGGDSLDYSNAVHQTFDGGYIIIGYTNSFGAGSDDVYLIKTDSVGDTLWTKTFGGINSDIGSSIQQTADGGYIIAGQTNSFGAGAVDVYLIRTDSIGDTLWAKTFGGTGDDLGYSVRQPDNGEFIISGSTNSFGSGIDDIYLIKTDSIGNLLCSKVFGGDSIDYGFSVQHVADGGCIFAGNTSSFGAGGIDVYLIKTDAYADTVWTRTFGGPDDDIGYSLQQTADGGFIILGETQSYGSWGYDIFVIKTDSVGYDGGCYQTAAGTIGILPLTLVNSTGTNIGSGATVMNTTTIVNNTATDVDKLNFSVSITDSTNVLCYGGSSGTATVTPSGGTSPFTYSWDDSSLQTGSIATGLPPGTYQVIVYDAIGCFNSATVTLTQPPVLSLSTTDSVPVLCNADSSAFATVTPAGGTPPYSYLWNDPDSQTDSTAVNLHSGTVQVIVNDANGCFDSAIISISFYTNITSSTNPVCGGICDGSATATSIQGTPPYTYSWNDSFTQTNSTANTLCEGVYTVNVTDGNGCEGMDNVTIIEPPPMNITITSKNADCNGGNDGYITAAVNGGATPYTFYWSTGVTVSGVPSSSIYSLAAGVYGVIVTDANGCSKSQSINITEPTQVTINSEASTDITCNGLTDGKITLTASGGTGTKSYSINNGITYPNTTGIFTGLSASSYTVKVRDAKLCVQTGSTLIINEPLTLILATIASPDISGNSGSAGVTAYGGNQPYSYQWDDPALQTTDLATGLAAGVYNIVVTDNNGCVNNAGVAVSDNNVWVFQKTFGGTNDGFSRSLQQTTDGGYIIAGYTKSFGAGDADVCLIRTDDNANILWAKVYGGSGDDRGYSVQQTNDGGYIIAGYTNSFGAGDYDIYLILTDADGDILWTKTYGGTGDDRGFSVLQSNDGGYTFTGGTNSFGAGLSDFYWVHTDDNGGLLWTKTIGGTGFDCGYSIQQTSDEGYIITGYTYSFGAGDADVYLIKTDVNGDTEWTKTIGGTDEDEGWSVRQTTDGGYIIAGYTNSFGAGSYDVYLIRTNAAGDISWSKTYGESGGDYGYSVQQTSDSGYIFTGVTSSTAANGEDVYLIRADANGDLLWTKTFGGEFSESGYSVQQTSDGGFIVAGFSSSFGGGVEEGDMEMYLIRTDDNGISGCNHSAGDTIVSNPTWNVTNGGTLGSGGAGYNTATIINSISLDDYILCFNTSITGIDQLHITEGDQVIVYPNPNRGLFNLILNLTPALSPAGSGQDITIRIFNMQGQLICSEHTSMLHKQIDLGKYHKGMYYVQVVTDSAVITRKVICQ